MSLVVGDESAGIAIRESDGPVTTNRARFVPHGILPHGILPHVIPPHGIRPRAILDGDPGLASGPREG